MAPTNPGELPSDLLSTGADHWEESKADTAGHAHLPNSSLANTPHATPRVAGSPSEAVYSQQCFDVFCGYPHEFHLDHMPLSFLSAT